MTSSIDIPFYQLAHNRLLANTEPEQKNPVNLRVHGGWMSAPSKERDRITFSETTNPTGSHSAPGLFDHAHHHWAHPHH